MARKLTVTTPRGTFTRKTDRLYTYVAVTGGFTEGEWRKRTEGEIAYSAKLAADYLAKAARSEAGERLSRYDEPAAYAEKLRTWAADLDARRSAAAAELESGQPTEDSVIGWAPNHIEVSWHGTLQLANKAHAARVAAGFRSIGVFPIDA